MPSDMQFRLFAKRFPPFLHFGSKKLALAQYDENVNDCINAMTSSDPVVVFSHPSSALDTASPMKSPRRSNSIVMTPSQLFQMRPCSVTKKTSSHWTKRGPIPSTNKVIQPKQLRRTVSEFPRPCSATTATESGNGMIHSLPCFDSLKDAIKRIDPVTLVDVLDGTISGSFEKLVVVDCRYPYEYVGGHIPGAINVNTPDQIEHLLFDSTSEFVGKKVAIVFHCEFSSERAPRMALHVRSYDRELNTANYPSLCYPEMYILDGGYKNFWKQFGERCEPPNAYVPMRNPFFKEELKLHQRAKYAFRSGTHLSQHSVVKTSHPAKRSRSLQPQEANRIFDDLLDCINRPGKAKPIWCFETILFMFLFSLLCFALRCVVLICFAFSDTNDLFPSHAISQSKSLSSILPSELDFPSEMDTEE